MRIRLLAIDMDGTCLNPRSKISEQTMEALLCLQVLRFRPEKY